MYRINNLYDHLDLFFPAEKSETHDSTAAFILDQTDLFKVRTVLNETEKGGGKNEISINNIFF